jgi:hypothetical protein
VKIEPDAIETASIGCDLKFASARNDTEASLDLCYELVCLGRPWPEILDALQRLKHVNKQRNLDLATELTDEQVGSDQPGETRPDCSRQIEPRTASTLRLPRTVAPLTLVGVICVLAMLAEATSPVARPSSAPPTATIAATFDSAALRPNSATPAELYGPRIARTGDVSPMPTAGGGILNTRLLAFGAGGTGAIQRNPAIPDVIRPKPRASAPADIHRRP